MEFRATRLTVSMLIMAATLPVPAACNEPGETRALKSGWVRSTDPSALILLVTLSGGYGSRNTRTFRLYGDGRLEETVARVGTPSAAPTQHSIGFNPAAADDLLNPLVSAGVAGLSEDGLLAAVRRQLPTASKLISGEDCARLSMELHLFRATGGSGVLEPVDSELSVECYGHFPRAYAQVPEAVALASLATQLDRLSSVRGEP